MRLRSILENKVMTLEEAEQWCKSNTVDNVKLKNTEIPGVFDCTSITLYKTTSDLPFKLRKCKGFFDAQGSNITTLENFPEICTRFYDISDCHKLKSLSGLPKIASDIVDVSGLKLPLLRLLLIKDVDEFWFNDDMIFSILNKHYKNGDRSAIVPCQDELIENGYEWAAKL